MRIALVNLTHGGFSGGYLKYLQRVVPRLLAHQDVHALDVFVPETARDLLRRDTWPFETFDARRPAGLAEVKRTVQTRRPDVVFVPAAAWVDFGDVPVVVMVRNMEPLEAPFGGNPLPAALKNLARRAMTRRACRRAQRIIAVSHHVQDFLIRTWSVDRRRIGVVYHGLGADDMPDPQRPAALEALDNRFLFTAGSIRPARGLTDVIGALTHLKAAGVAATAVIAGGVDAGMEPHARALERQASQLGVADRIVRAGRLDPASMRWCYEHAAAFVMTSRVEACPNTALEAMHAGCACVSVDRAPMPEFFGAAAAYYRAGDTRALAEVLRGVLGDEDRRHQLRAAAAQRASAFDWDDTACRTVAELQIAIGRRS